ncbi:predicted protein [Histoplasma mississippiense (nom. inval.)]|uniref:predicted protein n=1 Tax=Ajellomyces capsulatus (strain NAm1 / WU24) TaxID=2059318 RepID=UPI000157C15B|nr:predicted protein [Histoplasma mississippiense (nom. inval.)]EDN07340.1 predicted protein [Histoplasma mississippiense (nom. inval.)]
MATLRGELLNFMLIPLSLFTFYPHYRGYCIYSYQIGRWPAVANIVSERWLINLIITEKTIDGMSGRIRKHKTKQIATIAAIQGDISKRRKFVVGGVFYAGLNGFFLRELAEEGYSGVEVRVTPTGTDIIRLSLVYDLKSPMGLNSICFRNQ